MKKPSIQNPTHSLKLHSPRLALVAGVALAAWAVTPHQAAAAIVINDTFGDGALGTNTDGTGTGFTFYNAGTNSGTGTSTETGGQVTVTAVDGAGTTGNNNTVGIVSKNAFSVTATDVLTMTWDIAGATGVFANGITLGVRKSDVPSEFFTGPYFSIGLRESAAPTQTLQIQAQPGGVTTNFGTNALVTSQGYDGFTLTLVADAAGWSITSTGYASLAALEPISGGYGSSDFVSVFNGTFAAAYVQRGNQTNGTDATLTLNSITADVTAVPEPSTFGLAALGLLGLLRRRRI